MVGGERWEIFLMIRIVDVAWCSRPHRHKAHRYMPSRRWCNRSWISRTCRLGSLKYVQTIYTDPSRKIFEATWKSQGVDGLQPEYKRTLFFFVLFLYSWHVCFFSPLYRDELSMGVFLLCPTILIRFVQVSSAFRCWRCIHFFTSLMLLTPRQDNIRRRDNPWRFILQK